jgi:hypothetical protein
MNERYRYGYGEDVPSRETPLSGGSSVTDQREDEPGSADDDEERRADRIREAAEGRTDASGTAEGTDTAGTTDRTDSADATDSVFEVDDDAAGTEGSRAAAADREDADLESGRAPGETAPEELATTSEEREPIALGPPAHEEDKEATTGDDLAASTAGEPETTALEPDPSSDAATVTPAGATTDHQTSIFEPAPSSAADPLAAESEPTVAGTGPPLAESGTETPVVATEEPPIVLPDDEDDGASPVAEGLAVTADEPAPGTVEERTSLLSAIDPEETRTRFLDIQAGFVDEPRQAVHEAEGFVDELVQQLVRALETERSNLKATLESGSTEDLRLALRGYRAFVDRLLNLR